MRRGEAKNQVKAESEEELRKGYARSKYKASQDPRSSKIGGVVAVHQRRQPREVQAAVHDFGGERSGLQIPRWNSRGSAGALS